MTVSLSGVAAWIPRDLPFGTTDEVQAEVESACASSARGGFVFNTIHNVQPMSPVANVLAIYRTVQEAGTYSG